jgi:hypothetical protein
MFALMACLRLIVHHFLLLVNLLVVKVEQEIVKDAVKVEKAIVKDVVSGVKIYLVFIYLSDLPS